MKHRLRNQPQTVSNTRGFLEERGRGGEGGDVDGDSFLFFSFFKSHL